MVIADADSRQALADPQVREYVVGKEIHRSMPRKERIDAGAQ
jgi:hypothetical protein